MGDPDECAAIIDQVHGIFGPIYCLVNNAAVEWPMEAVELSPKRWQTVPLPAALFFLLASSGT